MAPSKGTKEPAVTIMMRTLNSRLVGRITGHRCPACGCSLLVNQAGYCWCTSCDFVSLVFDESRFIRLPVPEQLVWVE